MEEEELETKNVKKKTVSLLLAAAMILTSFPVSGKEARAAGTSDHSLPVKAFATKNQLMSAFTPDENENSPTTGKIAFGKNSTGAVQEWYILGKDNGVTGDNTVLFAAGPIATDQKFDENFNGSVINATKTYKGNWNCTYDSDDPFQVYVNHYGGSDVRAELNAIAKNAQYFTTAEQGLMNETRVTTNDTNATANYTTTDKLYALTADGSGSSYKTIKAGTYDQIVLAMSTYWYSGAYFWLRAPSTKNKALLAVPGHSVDSDTVHFENALVPAFNLNLSSVIFASAAKAASGNAETGTIAEGTAMTLRLNGSDKTIGTVVYDETTGNITAQKDVGAAGTVSLVVQGNDGTKDWYYSVTSGGATVVTKEQIRSACNISGDISFADCKIWLETTIDNVAYAKMAATPVTITGSDHTLTYDVSAIDVSKYFSIDKNAGTPTYSLVTESGVTTGMGNLSGKELTVTKIGVFKVKLTTAAQGTYAAGEKTITLTITSKSLTDSMVTIASGPHYYTGSAVTPAVTVKDGSKTLVSGTDYTVGYENNTNVGTATVTVTGKGNYTGTIGKTFDIILTDVDKVAAAKRVVEETLAGITATNSTTKQEIQDKIGEALTQAGMTEVTVTVGELEKTEATTEAAGSIDGTISIVSKKDSGETDSVPIIKTIEKLPKTEAEKVANVKKVVEKTLAGITATNSTTKQEIQDKIDEALTQAGITGVTVAVGELAKTEATTEAAGSIGGTISIVSKKDSSETDSVPIIKTIEKLPKTEAEKVANVKKIVEKTLAGITATNSTTTQEIQDKIDGALTQAGITDVTVTVGELAKTEATTEVAGSISGSITLDSDNDSSVTDSVPIIKTIEKLPKTEAEKVADAKKVAEDVLEEVLAGITTASEVTSEDIQREIDEALTNAGITDVTVTVGDLTKTEATTEEEGSISGSITLVSDNDSDVTDSVPIHKTIAQLHTHSYIWIITKSATEDEVGEMTGTCICGEVTTEEMPKTGESGTVIVKEDAENEYKGTLSDKEDVKGKVSLTDMEKEQLNAGEDLVIILRLKDVSVEVDTQEKTEIQNKLNTNILGTFLDIELLKQIGGTETKITETTDEIEITFEIPNHLWNTDDTVIRTYQIMRHHDGEVDILDVENYDETAHLLTFKTDKFSTYALVYRDAAKNPTATPGPTEIPETPSPTPGGNDKPTETPDDGIKPSPTPGGEDNVTPTPSPAEKPQKASGKEKRTAELHSSLKAVQTGKNFQVSWGRVNGADGYDVYVQYCGKTFNAKSLNQVKSGKKTKITVKKVNGRKLDTTKSFKLYVVAYQWKDGKKLTLAKTLTIHIAGKDSVKYTNVKKIKVKKSSYTLGKGNTVTLRPKAVLHDKRKIQLSEEHTNEFHYMSSDKNIATVTAGGKVKAQGTGSCAIYVFAKNGCIRKIKIKVKK